MRRVDVEVQLTSFEINENLSAGLAGLGPIFVPRSGKKKVGPPLPMAHVRATSAIAALKGDEISLIATFNETWGAGRAAEIQAVKDKIWHPGTRQFKVVADTPNRNAKLTTLRSVSNVSDLLDEVLARPKDSIRRLNIITHANPGIISLAGRFEGENVFLDPAASVGGQPIAGALDGSVIVWLNEDDIGRVQRDEMRTRFTKHGEILLFLCNGGLGTGLSLVQDIALCLNVRVLAYNDPIGYYVDFEGGKLDRNLTSKGLVPDSGFEGAKASGKIAAGYPCIVEVPAGVSDGRHVRPDKNVDKPKNPKS